MLATNHHTSVGFPGESPARFAEVSVAHQTELVLERSKSGSSNASTGAYAVSPDAASPEAEGRRNRQDANSVADNGDASPVTNGSNITSSAPAFTDPSSPVVTKKRRLPSAESPLAKILRAAATFRSKPAIVCRPKILDLDASRCSSQSNDESDENIIRAPQTYVTVPCWPADPMSRRMAEHNARSNSQDSAQRKSSSAGLRQSVHKVARQKGVSSGRKYTSKYRGVHQTFPTRRWEAQFRRAGKPTSLGCFDREEEAARAYDKMMVWVELHSYEMRNLQGPPQLKGGTTNFEISEYMDDIPELQAVSQEELVQALRREGRSQAAANTAAALKARPGISVCAKA
mmetsp:Transcript_38420/g.46335  ORF Transcript_38420/g.46335 Transcript_38420/m.46335 type:complete len:344 (+) Transcript_38420:387-1418(+)|eukprot:CAMPEP_0197846148 /NCGR_PEP_ID=MMETSP1438-20131217/2947_1 /TAXON_ID=1461541 /ORGANISM="Pterosperma sp., Strain CCMP1384" /LENGTH=343 /DNA_ID=CAMNT_0043457695 /DNA_START=387 /DNA_END=1418 /DNA_ORIENTATION=-